MKIADRKTWEENLIALRREFHRCPEPSWREFRTTARIAEELEKLGLKVNMGRSIHCSEKRFFVPSDEELEACWQRAEQELGRPLPEELRGGFTGCTAVIEGALPGVTKAIRVDIDCNDIQETSDPAHLPNAEGFASTHEKNMHACGHDAHAAIGIGAAQLLCANRDKLRGKVILVFQPGEEDIVGAMSMTETGFLDDCSRLFGLHVGIAANPVGTVVAGCHGILAVNRFDVHFHGRAAHAGVSPELGHNALAAASTAVLNLLAIPRHNDGASRINIGLMQAGTARNIIPAEAELSVETRGATQTVNDFMEASVRRVLRSAADMYECTCDMEL